MAEHRPIPSQDPAEGARDIVDRELERKEKAERKNGTFKSETPKAEKDGEAESDGSGEKIAVPTPIEPGDQNAQTIPP
jgi:hypothetical protein